jgi:hypothetical protein
MYKVGETVVLLATRPRAIAGPGLAIMYSLLIPLEKRDDFRIARKFSDEF